MPLVKFGQPVVKTGRGKRARIQEPAWTCPLCLTQGYYSTQKCATPGCPNWRGQTESTLVWLTGPIPPIDLGRFAQWRENLARSGRWTRPSDETPVQADQGD